MEKAPSDPRKYIETVVAQKAKRTGMICGDFVAVERTDEATTAVLADGIGTGVKARVAAVMYASRLMGVHPPRVHPEGGLYEGRRHHA